MSERRWASANARQVQAILDEPHDRQDKREWRASWMQDDEFVTARIIRVRGQEPMAVHIHQLHIAALSSQLVDHIGADEIVAFLGLGAVEPVAWVETGYRGEIATVSSLPADNGRRH